MLASHNSYTFLSPRRWWHKFTTPLWRCQTHNIKAQIDAGARLLDIRVRWDAKGRGWRPCHGAVDLGKFCYLYLGALTLRTVPCRIILERRSSDDVARFADAVAELVDFGIPVSVAAVKRGWKIIYRNPSIDDRCEDHYYKPFDSTRSLWSNLSNLLRHPSTIARYARANAAGRYGWAADPDRYHLIDLI